VIDEFYGWMPLDFILRLFDRYPLLVPVKGAHAQFVSKKILVTSNKHPIDWYRNIDQVHIPALMRRIEVVYHYDVLGRITRSTEDTVLEVDANHLAIVTVD